MVKILIVALGGALGAVARYGLSGLIHRHFKGGFPVGTLAVNAVGCLAIGGLLYLVEDRSMLGPRTRLFLAIGILGSFTTFSSFGYETMELLREGAFGMALVNVAGNVILGLGAVWLGRILLKAVGV